MGSLSIADLIHPAEQGVAPSAPEQWRRRLGAIVRFGLTCSLVSLIGAPVPAKSSTLRHLEVSFRGVVPAVCHEQEAARQTLNRQTRRAKLLQDTPGARRPLGPPQRVCLFD